LTETNRKLWGFALMKERNNLRTDVRLCGASPQVQALTREGVCEIRS